MKKNKEEFTDSDTGSEEKWPNSYEQTNRIKEILFGSELFIQKEEKVSLAGRVIKIRKTSSFFFADLFDETGKIQLKVKRKENNEHFFSVNAGDIIGVKGLVCYTESKELSLNVLSFKILSKCFRSLPGNYYGFKDIEERLRKRYLEYLTNPNSRQKLIIRHRTTSLIRSFLEEKSFIEIETPVLVSQASGAQAKPFKTFHNKLQRDFYLRIATEIPLKQLLVGGFERIYEIGRVFRNEGIDARHNPEFTTIEIYYAYKNCSFMADLTEDLFLFLFRKILTKKELMFNGTIIQVGNKIKRITMIDAVCEQTGIDFTNIDEKKALDLVQEHDIKLEPFQNSVGHILYAFFEKFVERNLIQPTFVFDFPIEVSPLAKKKNKSLFADRFELFIGGIEFANGYSELNDPFEQEKRFICQKKQSDLGNEEISSPDDEFVESLFYGMPPAGGLGIGIDRLLMLLTESESIKEVIAFPQLKKNKA